MPLEKSGSKEAFEHNVAKEIEAGKPQKQAVAIAYATQRSADELPQTVSVADCAEVAKRHWEQK